MLLLLLLPLFLLPPLFLLLLSLPKQFAVLYDTWQHGGSFRPYDDGGGDGGGDDGDAHDGDSGDSSVSDGKRKATSSSPPPSSPPPATANSNSKPCAQTRQENQLKQAVLKLQESEDQGQSLMFSYAVLTTCAAPRLAWLHERCYIHATQQYE